MAFVVCRTTLQKLFLADVKSASADPAVAFGAAVQDPTPENIREYAVARQVEAFVKKARPIGGVPKELREMARATFRELNDACGGYVEPSEISHVLDMAKSWVHYVLPPLASIEDEMWPMCGFGPGASFASGGPEGRHVVAKVSGKQSSTLPALRVAAVVLKDFFPNFFDHLFGEGRVVLTRGNRSEYVPKDVSKARRISVEPTLNLFLQMGVGRWMSKRLLSFGLTLNDQERNKRLAKQGSIDGSYSTLDLSNASDTVSTYLVKRLLPPDWFELLDALRSKFWLEDGEWYEYHTFSPQGNAFTFPLETLIFWAIGKSVTDWNTAYGDDLICDTPSFARYVDILTACGFKINEAKSYGGTVPFRESCGGDYLAGVDVRPVYYKDECVRYSQVCVLHNLLMSKWGDLPLTFQYLRLCVPSKAALTGPRYVVSSTDTVAVFRNPISGDLQVRTEVGETVVLGTKKVSVFNTVYEPLEYYFWDPEADLGVTDYRIFAKKAKPLNWSSTSDRGRELAFIYAGRDVEQSSSLTSYYMRRCKLTPWLELR